MRSTRVSIGLARIFSTSGTTVPEAETVASSGPTSTRAVRSVA
jgi:hypothetical protein